MNFDECDKLFRLIEQASSPAEVCHGLQPLFNYYKLMNIELGRGDTFWRARFSQAEPWKTINDMSYPPAEYVISSGRLNDSHIPCLYAATQIETALHEIGVKENDLVQVVGFRVKNETPIRIARVGELLHVNKTGYLRLTGNDPDGTTQRYLNSLGPDRGRRVLYIDAFLSDILSDVKAREIDYIRSRAVASMVYRNPKTDGIIFPSVKDNLGMNISLHAKAVDTKIHPVSCQQVRIIRIHLFGFIEYEVIKEVVRITEDGEFVWADPLPSPQRRYFNLTKEEYEAAVTRYSGSRYSGSE